VRRNSSDLAAGLAEVTGGSATTPADPGRQPEFLQVASEFCIAIHNFDPNQGVIVNI
jgi:hypothetical protein